MNLLTKKIPTILGLVFIGVAVGAYFYFFQNKSSTTSQEIIPQKIKITNVADNKFSVSWITQGPTKGSMEYGAVGEKLANVAKDDRDNTGNGTFLTHHVTIEKLQPNTQYAFRIISGNKAAKFDNNGSPYTVTTGPVIGVTPKSINFYGSVQMAGKQPATESIVYLTLPGGGTNSVLIGGTGNYAFTLSTMRSSDYKSYVEFDPSATIANIEVETGNAQSIANVTLANSTPVPVITLGQNQDFLTVADTPSIAEVKPQGETPSIFNVEPIAGNDINAVTTPSVTLTNPKDEGETLKTLRPEFRGTGPAGTALSIALTGQKAISDTVEIEADKTWSWSPVIDLKEGKQKITVSYIASSGATTKIERGFTVSTSSTGLDPAFVASPSASVKASAKASSTATPRAAMPATDSGVPVTGVIENTLLTAGLGIVIMVIGAALLVL